MVGKVRVLGLVGLTHDSGLALLDDGLPVVVLEEERLNREKRTKAFPTQSLLAALGPDLRDLDSIDVIATPWDVGRLRLSFGKAILK